MTAFERLLQERADVESRMLNAEDAADDELREAEGAPWLSDADRDAIFAHLHGGDTDEAAPMANIDGTATPMPHIADAMLRGRWEAILEKIKAGPDTFAERDLQELREICGELEDTPNGGTMLARMSAELLSARLRTMDKKIAAGPATFSDAEIRELGAIVQQVVEEEDPSPLSTSPRSFGNC